eukprot:2228369-Amphidinium_carterae.1
MSIRSRQTAYSIPLVKLGLVLSQAMDNEVQIVDDGIMIHGAAKLGTATYQYLVVSLRRAKKQLRPRSAPSMPCLSADQHLTQNMQYGCHMLTAPTRRRS